MLFVLVAQRFESIATERTPFARAEKCFIFIEEGPRKDERACPSTHWLKDPSQARYVLRKREKMKGKEKREKRERKREAVAGGKTREARTNEAL